MIVLVVMVIKSVRRPIAQLASTLQFSFGAKVLTTGNQHLNLKLRGFCFTGKTSFRYRTVTLLYLKVTMISCNIRSVTRYRRISGQ